MATRTWSAAADGNWSLAANWDGGISVPATTDAIVFDITSVKNCTLDNLGTWSGGTVTISSSYSGTIAQNSGINFTSAAYLQNGGTFTGHSAATFNSTTFSVTGGTFTQGGTFTCTTFGVTGTGTFTGLSGTMNTGALTFSNTAVLTATSGTWNCSGNMTKSNTPTFNHNSGTINLNGTTTQTINMGVTFNLFTVNNTGLATNVVVSSGTTMPLGTNPVTTAGGGSGVYGTFTVTGTVTATGTWDHSGSITISAGTGVLSGATTVIMHGPGVNWNVSSSSTIPSGLNVTINSITSVAAVTVFTGGGKTYGVLYITPSVESTTTSIASANTFTEIKCNDGLKVTTLAFTSGITQTITTFTVAGASGKLVFLFSTVAGTAAILSTASGAKSGDYLAIRDNTVDASPTWTAGAHSHNLGGNTNWLGFESGGSTTNVIGRGMRVRQSS